MKVFKISTFLGILLLCGAAFAQEEMTEKEDNAPAAKEEPAASQPAKKWPPGAGTKEWKDTEFVHPPIKSHELYKRMHEFPVSAWCFHGQKGQSPYAEKYVRDFKAVGFNVMIDDPKILPFAEKVGGVWVQIGETKTIFGKSPQYLESYVFQGKWGDHPLLQGIILGDNGRGFGGNEKRVATWLKKEHPHVAPIMSNYPCRVSGDSDLRILHMQNYPYLRGARGEKAANAYLGQCNSDRNVCNREKLAMWECYGGGAPYSCVQFQMIGAMAYGAQGLSNFCYSPHRMTMYTPGSDMIPKWYAMHQYIIHVLGRHVWGLRSMDVLHAVCGGAHKGASVYDAGQLVLRGSEFTMVGLLTPEEKFYSANAADREIPEYFMLVDKRTGGSTPPARQVGIMLSPKVSAVELIDANATKDAKIRQIVPAFKVRVNMEGSYGVMLRVAPDMETLLGGPEGAKLYAKINTAMAALQAKATPPAPAGQTKLGAEGPAAKPEADLPLVKVDAGEVDKTVAAAKTDATALAKVLDAAATAGKISKEQAADTIKRLNDAIDATAAETKDPKPSAS
ncbi:MAG: hypothetical protein LLG01_08305 [Planctomycetaceae bacterium]|nr:hypothetical protein [Planctomycetaceae bacterium]